ncbi:MAG: hypothetical protein B9S34_06400 [Opitutia bacterium Tous-C1TDCM]|nr:MAG: hypothetical protein B9S34_06400 [Opitutae bacterium Tous-C1TDCM]
MKRLTWFFLALGAGLAGAYLLPNSARAQPAGNRNVPHLAFAYPAGGQIGTTFTVRIGGQYLNGTTAAHFSVAGISARVLGHERPLTQKEINDLRDRQQVLQDKRNAARKDPKLPALTAAEDEEVAAIRRELAGRGNRQLSPVLAETVTLEISVPADLAPGDCELRLRTATGISNPVVFVLGQLPEFTEPARIATSPAASVRPSKELDPQTKRPKTERRVVLPAVVNGQIMPGEVDRFHFTATKGQKLVLAARARALMPYLADAVPGWFQATLALYDAQGRELAYNDDFRFSPDPVLCFEIPADGTYVAEIKDAIYRGREDFVYRIAVGEFPYATGVYPLGAAVGSPARFELHGWNMPAETLDLPTAGRSPGVLTVSARQKGTLSNPVRIALDAGTDDAEEETASATAAGQRVALPVTVNGRIACPGNRDTYRFSGQAGQIFVARITARRLGSPLDSILTLQDAAGRSLASNDDTADRGAGLLPHHADSLLTFTLPADGDYTVTVADTQHQGSPDHAYRLYLGPPQPGFELRVVPSGLNVRAGASVPVTVYALRHDGFTGEIMLALADSPWGFALGGAKIPAGQDKVQATLTAPYGARDELVPLRLVGRADIGGRVIERTGLPAEDMMQAFFYHHLVPAQEGVVQVSGRGAPFRVAAKGALKIIPGGPPAKLQIIAPTVRTTGKITFELQDPPPGISLGHMVSGRGDTVSIEVLGDPAALKPGTQGNLVLQAFGERPAGKAAPKNARPTRVPLGTVPAVAYEVRDHPGPVF